MPAASTQEEIIRQTLVVANAGWTVNQWVGYSVTNTTQRVNTRTGSRIPSQQLHYGKYE